jgi:hypothetical protein
MSSSTSSVNHYRSDIRNATTTSSNNSNSNNTTVAKEDYEEIIQAKVACMMKEYRHIVNTQVVPRSSRTSTSTSSYATGNRTDHPLQDDITGSRSKVTFPVKLYILLKLAPKYGCHSIISWLAHGRSFKIHHRDLFPSYRCGKVRSRCLVIFISILPPLFSSLSLS